MGSLVVLLSLILASSVEASYEEGKAFGYTKRFKIEPALINEIPHYEKETKEHYANINGRELAIKAKETAKDNEAVKVMKESLAGDKSFSHTILFDALPMKDIKVCGYSKCAPSLGISSKDFFPAISKLKSIEASVDEFLYADLGWIQLAGVFKGVVAKCRKAWGGFSNCCKEAGWGHDIDLAGCNEQEKELAKKNEKKLCHKIGSYCSKKSPLGNCLEHKSVYCCFYSKLSRIIMEHAYLQLGFSWGNAKEPKCHGLSIEELKKINLDKIDFSEYVEDINQNLKLKKPDGLIKELKKEAKA